MMRQMKKLKNGFTNGLDKKERTFGNYRRKNTIYHR